MKVPEYYKNIFNVSLRFGVFANMFVFMWNVMPMINSIKDYFIYGGRFRRDLCYFIWYPWDYENGSFWMYLLSYSIDVIAGVFAGVTFTNIDLILCAVITQICMHFDHISRSMEEYVPTGNLQDDYGFIIPVIKLHRKCLR